MMKFNKIIALLFLGTLLMSAQISSIPSSVAAVGLPGPAGPAGPIGPPGPAGVDGAQGVPGYSPNSLISGGGVVWTSGLSFHVSAATYLVNNTQYTSAATDLTLSAADATNDRIDVIVVNSSGAVAVLEGTPAAPPFPETADPSSQLQLSWVYVAAGATTPSNVVTTDVYHENTEWTSSRTGTPIVLASTNNPHAGTKCIEATLTTTGNYFTLVAPAPFDPNGKNNLVFWIRSKAAWPSTRSLQIRWMLSTANKGSIITLNEGAFGFNSSLTTDYQQIVIPMALFQAGGLSVDRLRVTTSGSGATFGWYVDDIILQSGVPPATAPASMVWKDSWNSSITYVVNEVVSYNGSIWSALASSTNSAPTVTNTNWSLVGGVALDGTPNTDLTSTGPQTNTFAAGASITVMDLCYLGSSSKWLLTDADAASTTAGMLGISLETKTDTNLMNVALPGSFVRNDSWNWTPGAVLYVDTATAGAITDTQPTGPDDAIRVIGYAVTADVIYFMPSPNYITHTD